MVSPFSLPLKNKSMDYEIEASKLGNGYVVLINKLFYQRIFFSPDQVRFLTRLVISDLFLSPRHGISIVSPPGKQIHGLYETEASTLGHGSVVLINELLNQRLFSSPDQLLDSQSLKMAPQHHRWSCFLTWALWLSMVDADWWILQEAWNVQNYLIFLTFDGLSTTIPTQLVHKLNMMSRKINIKEPHVGLQHRFWSCFFRWAHGFIWSAVAITLRRFKAMAYDMLKDSRKLNVGVVRFSYQTN